jgi:hypothetical protein
VRDTGTLRVRLDGPRRDDQERAVYRLEEASMFALDSVIVAVALLTGSPDTVRPGGGAEMHALLAPTLQTLAVQWEILDPREMRYVLARPEDFSSDLQLLRRRYHELTEAPMLQDCERFPDRATVNDLLAFNRAYRRHIDVRQPVELSRWWELRTVLQETEYLYQVWDKVRDARCEYYYVTVRRKALKDLRDMVGDDAYYSGQLPPYVPVWRFQPVD